MQGALQRDVPGGHLLPGQAAGGAPLLPPPPLPLPHHILPDGGAGPQARQVSYRPPHRPPSRPGGRFSR